MAWSPLAVLPNVLLADPIEATPLALVPLSDDRATRLCDEHATLAEFLSRFSTEHGTIVEPTILLAELTAQDLPYNAEAMVAFRNCISVATILRSYVASLNHGAQHRIMYSNAFEIYPWMLDRNQEHLISFTPAQWALHNVEDFQGQSIAGVPVQGFG